MKPIYVRQLTVHEIKQLEKGLQSSQAFTVRRCQIILKSARGMKVAEIAQHLNCSGQAVRKGIHQFEEEGLSSLIEKSHRPHSQVFSFGAEALAKLPQLVEQSPREYGWHHSLWSLERLAQTCYQIGWIEQEISYETMRTALKRAGIDWKRMRKRLPTTDPAYPVKKNDAND